MLSNIFNRMLIVVTINDKSWGDIMRLIHFLTWNTQLFEMGNILRKNQEVKSINMNVFDEIIKKVKDFLNSKDEAIVILQEIPYKSNIDFKEHELFNKFNFAFPDKMYKKIYNISSESQIKMTVVLSKITNDNPIILPNNNCVNNNKCVSFSIVDLNLLILGVHSHNAKELYDSLSKYQSPDMMIGDFNSGDYNKRNEDSDFKNNKNYYKKLVNGYTDICNGNNTRKIIFQNGFNYETPIDHVLLKNKSELTHYKCELVKIDRSVDSLSDHYPIYFTLKLND